MRGKSMCHVPHLPVGPVPGQRGHDSNSLFLSPSFLFPSLVTSSWSSATKWRSSSTWGQLPQLWLLLQPYWHWSKGCPTAWNLAVSFFPPKLSAGICVSQGGAELREVITFCWIKATLSWSGWLVELQVLPEQPAVQTAAQTALPSVCLPCLWCSWLLMLPKGFCQMWRWRFSQHCSLRPQHWWGCPSNSLGLDTSLQDRHWSAGVFGKVWKRPSKTHSKSNEAGEGSREEGTPARETQQEKYQSTLLESNIKINLSQSNQYTFWCQNLLHFHSPLVFKCIW